MNMAPKNEDAYSSSDNTTCGKQQCASKKYDYDLIVIGDDQGGLTAAKEASALHATVAVLSCSTPSLNCAQSWREIFVHFRCIAKKLSYQAALLGEAVNDSKFYGWEVEENIRHSWKVLIDALRRQITCSRQTYIKELKDNKIHFIRGQGSFKDPHTIYIAEDGGEKYDLKAKYILIAVGTTPLYPDIRGTEKYGITSGDVLNLQNPPGKTLIIGTGSTGIQCASFLHGLGYEITVMNKNSTLLKRFDQQIAGILLSEMELRGVKFLFNCHPRSLHKSICSGKLTISWNNDQNEYFTDIFDTVIFATGERALTKELKLEIAGVQVTGDENKINTINEQTNIPHIYAVGAVLYDKPESDGIAMQAGKLLARRLFECSTVNMDYELFTTTLYTPIEYGTLGFSEEAAISRHGEDNLEVYHGYYHPTEFFLPERKADNCYLKVVALREGKRNVLGMHFIGPNAGDIMQGFLVAVRCGLTMDQLLNNIVGVHPTNALQFTRLTITKRSGLDPHPPACCS